VGFLVGLLVGFAVRRFGHPSLTFDALVDAGPASASAAPSNSGERRRRHDRTDARRVGHRDAYV
jgi:hypothetical protein